MKATRTLIASALLLAATLASAQMPAALRDANAPAAGDWAKASAVLRAAIECREALPPVASVLGTFGLTNHQLDGDHKLPEALTVFGTLKVSAISIFHGDEEEGSSYTVRPMAAKMADVVKAPESGFDSWAAENVAPLVVWLGSEASSHVSGQVFESQGGRISVCDGWRTGPQKDKGARLTPAEAGAAVDELMKQSVPAQKVWGS